MSAESTVLLTTSCPTCGEIDAPLSSVVLRVCEEAETSTCVITCGTCHERFEKPADDNMTLLLVTLGVDVSVWSLEPVADRHDELGPWTPSATSSPTRRGSPRDLPRCERPNRTPNRIPGRALIQTC